MLTTGTFLLAQSDDAVAAAAGAVMLMILLFELALAVAMIAGMWACFVKAGKPGWAAIVPIYNIIVTLEVAKKPLWWVVLFIVPFVNFIAWLLVCLDFAKNFGKGGGFGVGLALLPFIFYPILGFGKDQYQG